MTNVLRCIGDRRVGLGARPLHPALQAGTSLSPATLITGASRGIGLALADRFARAGHRLVLVARDEARLAERTASLPAVPAGPHVSMAIDVTREDAIALIDQRLAAKFLYLDILVNNAGVGLSGSFADLDPVKIDELVQLNIAAVTRLTRYALPDMLARGRGGILNIASLGAMVPGPGQAAYYASKAYVVSLTEAIAAENAGRGVRIAVVAPGPVETGFHAAMGAEHALYRTALRAVSPESVAASAYRGFVIGRCVIVPGMLPTLGQIALRLLPHAITVPIVRALLSMPESTKTPDDR